MKNIEIKLLNPESLKEAEKMAVCAARLTQRGHKIKGLSDFEKLYDKEYSNEIIKNLANLPHPTLQKFTVINIVVVGASRRFLAQITRHQNEVKFMSASLQYSDYSDGAMFVIPYALIGKDKETSEYIKQCISSFNTYKALIESGTNNDSAGYVMPQSLRNTLIISATPYQWKHMIRQRICRRNTEETRYVMLKIWEVLYDESPALFENAYPECSYSKCPEGKMSCGKAFEDFTCPNAILKQDFYKLYE